MCTARWRPSPTASPTARSLWGTGKGRRVLRPLALGGGACFGAQRARGREFNGVDDLGVYSPAPVADDGLVHFALDLDAEPFTPPRTSTPPHPSHFYFHFSPSAFLCSPLSPRCGSIGIDILTTALMLIASACPNSAHLPPLERADPPQVAPPPPAPKLVVPFDARTVLRLFPNPSSHFIAESDRTTATRLVTSTLLPLFLLSFTCLDHDFTC
ncbi:hypothetical protein K438DRAFT_1834051 [Mycena galopus ATCC 62051]|nr:hypothetical protein K438DRAFT_1834051 [Mycena galopus ATCC 62051]